MDYQQVISFLAEEAAAAGDYQFENSVKKIFPLSPLFAEYEQKLLDCLLEIINEHNKSVYSKFSNATKQPRRMIADGFPTPQKPQEDKQTKIIVNRCIQTVDYDEPSVPSNSPLLQEQGTSSGRPTGLPHVEPLAAKIIEEPARVDDFMEAPGYAEEEEITDLTAPQASVADKHKDEQTIPSEAWTLIKKYLQDYKNDPNAWKAYESYEIPQQTTANIRKPSRDANPAMWWMETTLLCVTEGGKILNNLWDSDIKLYIRYKVSDKAKEPALYVAMRDGGLEPWRGNDLVGLLQNQIHGEKQGTIEAWFLTQTEWSLIILVQRTGGNFLVYDETPKPLVLNGFDAVKCGIWVRKPNGMQFITRHKQLGWALPPCPPQAAEIDGESQENPPKRQRRRPQFYGHKSYNSQGLSSAEEQMIAAITACKVPDCWEMNYDEGRTYDAIHERSHVYKLGRQYTGADAVHPCEYNLTGKNGRFKGDFVCEFTPKGDSTGAGVRFHYECDENNGHENRCGSDEMFRMASLSQNGVNDKLIVWIRINPEAELLGSEEGWEYVIETVTNYILSCALKVWSAGERKIVIPIFYLFYPDEHAYQYQNDPKNENLERWGPCPVPKTTYKIPDTELCFRFQYLAMKDKLQANPSSHSSWVPQLILSELPEPENDDQGGPSNYYQP